MKLNNLNLNQFQVLARQLSRKWRLPRKIGLVGGLGSGKTTFVQSFLTTRHQKPIKSPSFVIVHEYKLRRQIVYHLDLYRLKHFDQLTNLGLDEILDGKHFVLIEWSDRFPKLSSWLDTLVKIKINPDGTRNVSIKNLKN